MTQNLEKNEVKGPSWLAWQLGAAMLVLVSGSVGYTATSSILKLPEVSNCSKVYWPMASASTRLYCAELQANKKTGDDILEAISSVEVVPQSNPLRKEINRKVETWAEDILDIGEKQFQRGEIDGAIATARKIPPNVKAYNLVEDKIKHWQSIWSQAEKIYTEAENQLKASQWDRAFSSAVKLANVNNEYWSQTKYEETIARIKEAQEESGKLDTAYTRLKKGKLDDLLDAMERADKISSKSYAFKEAQTIIADAKIKVVKEIDRLVSNRDWQTLARVVNRIPASAGLKEEVKDWNNLASAGSSARLGSISSLESAIEAAKRIDKTRPLYYKAQKLIKRWTLEIQGVSHISKARNLARGGRVSDLSAAISEARLVSRYNPRYQEAQKEISSWSRTIQIIQDRPILNRAYGLARNGSVTSLQQAISQASLISPNRPLYREAQGQISKWRANIYRQQDQPIFNRANSLAGSGDLLGAIQTAQKIRPGRPLYSRAQGSIRNWKSQIKARQDLDRAYRMASSGSTSALVDAINVARQIPSSTRYKQESYRAINTWSARLLDIAKNRSRSSLTEAIGIASKIPPGSPAYNRARLQIEIWRKKLQTPSPSSPDEI